MIVRLKNTSRTCSNTATSPRSHREFKFSALSRYTSPSVARPSLPHWLSDSTHASTITVLDHSRDDHCPHESITFIEFWCLGRQNCTTDVYFAENGDSLGFSPTAFIDTTKSRLILGTGIIDLQCQPLKDIFIYVPRFHYSVSAERTNVLIPSKISGQSVTGEGRGR